ncbi:MAG: HDIG domain-containing protein, partial [Endomicrobia bacterium]|nr:HDIG domain-containing protein [Endomicrobiia bacterium]
MKKFIVKLKPLLTKLLNKIEQIEQKLNLQQKVKLASKQKIILPDWIESIVLIILVTIGVIIKSLAIERVEKNEIFIRLISLFAIIYFITLVVISHYEKKIKLQLNVKTEEYNNDFKIFLTITLLQVSFFIFWQLNSISLYLLPFNGFVIITGLLLNLWWATVFIIINAIIGSYLIADVNIQMFVYMLITFLSSIYVLTLVEKISSRQDIISAIIKSVGVNFLIYVSVNLLTFYDIQKMFNVNISFKVFNRDTELNIFGFAICSILNGVTSWLVVTSLLSPFEVIYKRTTNIKLVELSNFNHPLLKRLMTEAPGTYHHSLVVSSLAENVALSLGLNSLLCKVGGFYHDVGKITQPEYFIENQFAVENPHGEINPSLSALGIINHVKEGINLAKEYKLDKPIVDIIEQHHGNSVIFGLYSKNLELNFFDKEILRYPGPKPQSKEAA